MVWALAAAVIFGHLLGWALAAADPTAADLPPRRIDPATTVIDPWAEPAKSARPIASTRAVTGNPLWAVPLSSLTVTRERPIFSPSRRPPPPAAIAAAYIAPVMPLPPKPPEPDHPLLTLLGTVVAGETEGIGIFINQINGSLVRLKTGEQHEGWILRAVRGREAMFEKNDQSATLVLPPRNGSEPAADLRAPAAVGGAPIGRCHVDGRRRPDGCASAYEGGATGRVDGDSRPRGGNAEVGRRPPLAQIGKSAQH